MSFTSRLFLVISSLLISISLFGQTDIDQLEEPCGFDQILQQQLAEDPLFAREYEYYFNTVLPSIQNNPFRSETPSTYLTIPIVFHITHGGEAIGTGRNLSLERIQGQMDFLNACYQARNQGIENAPARWADAVGNPLLQFCIAKVDPNGNPTDGIIRYGNLVEGSAASDQFQQANQWDPNRYLNVYLTEVSNSGLCGYARLPTSSLIGSSLDGIIVDHDCFGSGATGQSGNTLVHEIGHYLGLHHIWAGGGGAQGGSCSTDDGIDDTPNCSGPSQFSGCSNSSFPTGPESCGNEIMYINQMDYARDACQIIFTKGQTGVMRAVLEGLPNSLGWGNRKALVNNVEAVCSPGDIAGNQFDAVLQALVSPLAISCPGEMVTPVVIIANEGTETLTDLLVTYFVGGISKSKAIEESLAPGESIEVTLPGFTSPSEDYEIDVFLEAMFDGNITNNSQLVKIFVIATEDLPLQEDFESYVFSDTDNKVIAVDFNADGKTWKRANVSAYGVGNRSILIDNYNEGVEGARDALVFTPLNFSNITNAVLSFDIAYARYNPNIQVLDDRLLVLVSTDCGASYSFELYNGLGADLETADPMTLAFTPTDEQWKKIELDLAQFIGEENVAIAIINESGRGNRLYIDNINIDQSCSLSLTASTSNQSCFETCDGSANITVANNNGELGFLWDANAGAQTTSSVTGLCAGNYVVTVTDGACSSSMEITITAPTALTSLIESTNESAVNANDGTATATLSGGTSDYTYLWNTGATTASITQLTPGDYSLTATDANNCSVIENVSISAYQCTALGLVVNTNNLACFGDVNGSANIVLGDGVEAAQINWSNEMNGNNIENLATGNYSVSVSDAAGCEEVQNFTITQPNQINLNITANNETSFGANNGSATANVSGGTGTYTYAWSNGATSSSIENLAPGIYNLSLTDANGCTQEASTEILSINCNAFSVNINSSNTTCADICDASANIVVNGAQGEVNILWSNGATTAQLNNLCAGNYSVTVEDGVNCSTVSNITITAPSALSVQTTSSNESSFEANNGSASATVSGGTGNYTYQWSNGANTPDIQGLAAGTYFVSVTDQNQCELVSQVVIEAFVCVGPVVQIETRATECFGTCTGSAALNLAGNAADYTINWSNGASGLTISSLCAGDYKVTVTDAFDCSTTESFSIVESPELNLQLTSNNESALGASDGSASVTASGGTGAYTYSWSNGQTGNSISNLSPGSYGLTITDANACEKTTTFIIEQFVCASFNVSIQSTPANCKNECNGSATVSLSGTNEGVTAIWSNGATGLTANNLCAGSYTVSLTDGNNCEYVTTLNIDEPDELLVSVNTTNETAFNANDGTATASVSGGVTNYSYMWSTGATSSSINNLSPSNYSLTVTDVNGCSKINNFSISAVQCSSLSVSSNITNTSCANDCNGAIELTLTGASGEASFSWSNGMNTSTINALCAGQYTVSISDAVGCSLEQSFTVTEPDELLISLFATSETGNNFNDGVINATVSGGTGAYTYNWSNGATSSTINNLPAGTYTLTLTDNNACTSTSTAVLASFVCPTASVNTESIPSTCFGECDGVASISLADTEGISISWEDGQTGLQATGLCAGTVSVTVTDASNCTTVREVEVIQPDELILSISSTDETSNATNDGTATANVSGGTAGYQFNWSNGGTSPTINNLAPGNYQLTLTDANACTKISNVTITAFGCPQITFSQEAHATSCFDVCDGTASISLADSESFSVTWSNGQTGLQATELCAGKYQLTVTNADNCSSTSEVEILQAEELLLQIEAMNGDCRSLSAATANVSGGQSPYTYNWSNGATQKTIEDLEPGVYALTLTDANQCATISELNIEDASEILSFETTKNEITCYDAADGFLSVDILTGSAPFSYEWNTGDTTNAISNLSAGNYSLIITDANNCGLVQNFELNRPDSIVLEVIVVNNENDNNASAEVMVSGGIAPYSYEWSTGATSIKVEDLPNGTYTVSVTDVNGCEVVAEVFIDTTPVNEITNLSKINIFPNPTSGNLYLFAQFYNKENTTIRIYNVLGQIQWESSFEGNEIETQIDLQQYTSGTYFLQIKTKEGTLTKRVVVL